MTNFSISMPVQLGTETRIINLKFVNQMRHHYSSKALSRTGRHEPSQQLTRCRETLSTTLNREDPSSCPIQVVSKWLQQHFSARPRSSTPSTLGAPTSRSLDGDHTHGSHETCLRHQSVRDGSHARASSHQSRDDVRLTSSFLSQQVRQIALFRMPCN